jgi:hypothetical protein
MAWYEKTYITLALSEVEGLWSKMRLDCARREETIEKGANYESICFDQNPCR